MDDHPLDDRPGNELDPGNEEPMGHFRRDLQEERREHALASYAEPVAVSSIGRARYAAPLRTDVHDSGRLGMTLAEARLTREQALSLRARLAHFAEGWDDPALDVYDALPEG